MTFLTAASAYDGGVMAMTGLSVGASMMRDCQSGAVPRASERLPDIWPASVGHDPSIACRHHYAVARAHAADRECERPKPQFV